MSSDLGDLPILPINQSLINHFLSILSTPIEECFVGACDEFKQVNAREIIADIFGVAKIVVRGDHRRRGGLSWETTETDIRCGLPH